MTPFDVLRAMIRGSGSWPPEHPTQVSSLWLALLVVFNLAAAFARFPPVPLAQALLPVWVNAPFAFLVIVLPRIRHPSAPWIMAVIPMTLLLAGVATRP